MTRVPPAVRIQIDEIVRLDEDRLSWIRPGSKEVDFDKQWCAVGLQPLDGDRRGRVDRVDVTSHGNRRDNIDLAIGRKEKTISDFTVSVSHGEPHTVGLAQPAHDIKDFLLSVGNHHNIARIQNHVLRV